MSAAGADLPRRTTAAGWTATPPTAPSSGWPERAGITKRISPHSLRHSFITAALDAGVPLRDVQEAASHADPRTTMRYDRARRSLDRHATYIVADLRRRRHPHQLTIHGSRAIPSSRYRPAPPDTERIGTTFDAGVSPMHARYRNLLAAVADGGESAAKVDSATEHRRIADGVDQSGISSIRIVNVSAP